MKQCSKCGAIKREQEFPRNRRRADELDPQCRVCTRERMRRKRARHMAAGACSDCGEPLGESSSRWYCSRCATRYPTRGTRGSRAIRSAALQAYGGPRPGCSCCGEQLAEFLTLDHVEGGGRAHRRLKGNQSVYYELRARGYPAGFRVLCFNCNLAFGLYGACPHDGNVSPQRNNLAARQANDGEPVRTCSRCKEDLPLGAFYSDRGTRSGLQSRCRMCTREASITRLRDARRAALEYYGGGDPRCACCGEGRYEFLALDHVDPLVGPKRPAVYGGGNTFFARLVRQGFPQGLQVLCHNCNSAKGDGPACPHAKGAGTALSAEGRD